VTYKQAIQTVENILIENRENGELGGILNHHRIAALNRLLRTTRAIPQSGTSSTNSDVSESD